MLELDLKITKRSIVLPKIIRETYDKNIIFCLNNENDERRIFFNFVLMDFIKEEMIYIDTFSAENQKIIDNFDKDKKIKILKTPHSIIEVKKNKQFLCFTEEYHNDFFYFVDYEKQKFKFIFTSDFNLPEIWKIIAFSDTNFKENYNQDFFYTSVISKKENKKILSILKISLDLKKIEIIFLKEVSKNYSIPHTTKKIWNIVLLSHFYSKKLFNEKTWEEIWTIKLYHEVIKNLFLKYKREKDNLSKKETYALLRQINENSFERKNYNFFIENKPFIDSKINGIENLNFYLFIKKYLIINWYKNLFEYVQDSDLKIKVKKWEISIINLETKTLKKEETTFYDSAHFETDNKWNVFVSSHNFLKFDKQYYLWPAAIDKFSINQNGSLEYLNTFSNPKWCRFTSHRIFTYEGVDYLCTIWHPNRLFFVNAQTMEIFYYFDISQNLFWDLDWKEVIDFLNNENTHPWILAFEEKDWILILISSKSDEWIIFFDFKNRKIIKQLKYVNDSFFPRSFLNITHIEFLR